MTEWMSACRLSDVLEGAGACVLVGGRQIAVFRVGEAVYAIDNRDPAGDANVLSRGIVCDLEGEAVVASPLYKHHYSLATGRCLEDPVESVTVHPVKVLDGRIWVSVAARMLRAADADPLVCSCM